MPAREEAAIYVLNGFTYEGSSAFVELRARPVINSMTELAEWDAFVAAHAWLGGAALHVDTGMNRLGISAAEAAALAPRVQMENHGITLLMSHLACAEIAEHPLNNVQIRLFREIRALYPGVPASLANSSGIFLGDWTHCDLVRPGAALYGINPTPGHPNPMRGVVELTGRILQVREVGPGDTVGYGAMWTAKRRHAPRRGGARLRRRAHALREWNRPRRRRRRRRRQALPVRRPHFHGPGLHRHHRNAARRGPPGRHGDVHRRPA